MDFPWEQLTGEPPYLRFDGDDNEWSGAVTSTQTSLKILSIAEIPESITNGRYPGDYGIAKKELHFGLVARVIPL